MYEIFGRTALLGRWIVDETSPLWAPFSPEMHEERKRSATYRAALGLGGGGGGGRGQLPSSDVAFGDFGLGNEQQEYNTDEELDDEYGNNLRAYHEGLLGLTPPRPPLRERLAAVQASVGHGAATAGALAHRGLQLTEGVVEGGAKTALLLGAVPLAGTAAVAGGGCLLACFAPGNVAPQVLDPEPTGTAAAAALGLPAFGAYGAYAGTRAAVHGTHRAAQAGGTAASWVLHLAWEVVEWAVDTAGPEHPLIGPHVAERVWSTWLGMLLLAATLSLRMADRTARVVAGVVAAVAAVPAERLAHRRQAAAVVGWRRPGVGTAVPGPLKHIMLPSAARALIISSGGGGGGAGDLSRYGSSVSVPERTPSEAASIGVSVGSGVNVGSHGGGGLLSYMLAPMVMAAAAALACADFWAWRVRQMIARMWYVTIGTRAAALQPPLHVQPYRRQEEHAGGGSSGTAAAAAATAASSAPSYYPPASSVSAEAPAVSTSGLPPTGGPPTAFRLIPPIPVAYPGLGGGGPPGAGTYGAGSGYGHDKESFASPADAFAAALEFMGTATAGRLGRAGGGGTAAAAAAVPQHRRSNAHDQLPFEPPPPPAPRPAAAGHTSGSTTDGDVERARESYTSLKDRERERSVDLDVLDAADGGGAAGGTPAARSRHRPSVENHEHQHQHQHPRHHWGVFDKALRRDRRMSAEAEVDVSQQLRRSDAATSSGALTPPGSGGSTTAAAAAGADRQYPAGPIDASDAGGGGGGGVPKAHGRFFGYTPQTAGFNDGAAAAADGGEQQQQRQRHAKHGAGVAGALAGLVGKFTGGGGGGGDGGDGDGGGDYGGGNHGRSHHDQPQQQLQRQRDEEVSELQKLGGPLYHHNHGKVQHFGDMDVYERGGTAVDQGRTPAVTGANGNGAKKGLTLGAQPGV
ncbi:hypothetical protein VOLCADRAFT_94928 [Volvox carteri f. nagariensis]|uniref:Uncharacterized protein n=1 Tax=Volvox carteri f. nagariensis TaxID=3068 RepID=D8U654_VOLCA|nr:uncharacterized protein VOLCADRAFT_94928 [Volvox carteri f. nagariensis]EFJ44880.1 hypothetical protein VOLCADRAFT_94928 [Volvox carteri f. nagariensis]|eukprot:XP_002954163.1 hypothetical protein VOLCADRAFT_94928 [Volvox carteri f. nagariensis]